MRVLTLFVTALALLLTSAASAQDIQQSNLFPKVKFVTDKGDIVVELNRMRAPKTVDNFLTYVVQGKYDNTLFHRVIDEFVVQGGGFKPGFESIDTLDPVINESGNGLPNRFGTIAMARERDPHSATSQFYFNAADNDSLDPSTRRWGYAVFGRIESGEDVLRALAAVETDHDEETGYEDVPVEPLMLQSVELLPRD
jgi:peptidyl-prolyl cis-trans isomerase A (cyclophilin A)